MLPKDEIDEKNAILEVRAGTGGDEAALFATELFSMYQKYSSIKGWRFDILEVSENDIGGYREAIASITGRSVFARLKFESVYTAFSVYPPPNQAEEYIHLQLQ